MADDPKQRLFVAIAVPESVKAALREVQDELRRVLPPKLASWTRPDNMHMTLRFLGDVEASRSPDLHASLWQAIAGFGPVQLVCERLGCFPDLRYPRVVWAWAHDDQERLPQLVNQVNEATLPFAERPPDARFVGHITLARPRQIRRLEADALAKFGVAAAARGFCSWSAEELELIRSELSPGGSRYTTMARFPLT
jgi:2'-5' RNA ligase